MLLDREALEEAQEAVRFHTHELASALRERAALDGAWGWVARLWRTRARDVAHCDHRIAYHHQELQRAKRRQDELQAANVPASAAASIDLDEVAEHLQRIDHPLSERLRALDQRLEHLDRAHAAHGHVHRTGSALIAAARANTAPRTTGLTRRVAAWLAGTPNLEEPVRAFAAACRDVGIPFESALSVQSSADQAAQILEGLRDRAIEHRRERSGIEAERDAVLTRAHPLLSEASTTEPATTNPHSPAAATPPFQRS